jgi:lipopolysaccharide assembly protein A
MKFLGKIIFLPVAIAVVLFAIANRHEVGVNFWPLPFDAETPLYVALLGALALGILIGAAASSVSVGKWRWRARANARRSAKAPAATPDIMPAATGPVLPHQPSTLPAVRRAALDDD